MNTLKKYRKWIIIGVVGVIAIFIAIQIASQPEIVESQHFPGAPAINFDPHGASFTAPIDGQISHGDAFFSLTDGKFVLDYAFAESIVADGNEVKKDQAIGIGLATIVQLTVRQADTQTFINPTHFFKQMKYGTSSSTTNTSVWLIVIVVLFIGAIIVGSRPKLLEKVFIGILLIVVFIIIVAVFNPFLAKANGSIQSTLVAPEPTQSETVLPVENPTVVPTEAPIETNTRVYDVNCALKPYWTNYPYNAILRWEEFIEKACSGVVVRLRESSDPKRDHALQEDIQLADLIAAVIYNENPGDTYTISVSGAVGPMQIMPCEAADKWPSLRGRPCTPELLNFEFNIDFGTKLLIGYYESCGDWVEALFHYGPIDQGYGYANDVWNDYLDSISSD